MPYFPARHPIAETCRESSTRVSKALSVALNALKMELAYYAEVATNPATDPERRAEFTRQCSRLTNDVDAVDNLREQCEFRLSSIAGRHAARHSDAR